MTYNGTIQYTELCNSKFVEIVPFCAVTTMPRVQSEVHLEMLNQRTWLASTKPYGTSLR